MVNLPPPASETVTTLSNRRLEWFSKRHPSNERTKQFSPKKRKEGRRGRNEEEEAAWRVCHWLAQIRGTAGSARVPIWWISVRDFDAGRRTDLNRTPKVRILAPAKAAESPPINTRAAAVIDIQTRNTHPRWYVPRSGQSKCEKKREREREREREEEERTQGEGVKEEEGKGRRWTRWDGRGTKSRADFRPWGEKVANRGFLLRWIVIFVFISFATVVCFFFLSGGRGFDNVCGMFVA